MNPQKNLKIAIKAAKKAGKYLNKKRNNVKVFSNKKRDIKLDLDIISEKIVLNILGKTKYSILSEEKGRINKNSNYIWIIDPLDGSLNYFKKIPLCCVSIALFDKNLNPVLGVIYDFFNNNIYTGIVGKGAYLNKKRISMSNVSEKSKAVLATGFPTNSNFTKQRLNKKIKEFREYKKVRLLGSAALSLAFTACGKTDAYTEDGIYLWDIAAGIAILSSAKGKYFLKKKEKDKYYIFASNKFLFQEIKN